MKSADIKVGEHYLAGWYGQVEVIETRVERIIGRGGKSRRDGVKVRVMGGHTPGVTVVLSSSAIQQTWADYQKRLKAEQLTREINAELRQDGELLLPQLETALEEKGIQLQRHWLSWGGKNGKQSIAANINLSIEDLQKLLQLVSETAAKPDSGSALSQLFATSP